MKKTLVGWSGNVLTSKVLEWPSLTMLRKIKRKLHDRIMTPMFKWFCLSNPLPVFLKMGTVFWKKFLVNRRTGYRSSSFQNLFSVLVVSCRLSFWKGCRAKKWMAYYTFGAFLHWPTCVCWGFIRFVGRVAVASWINSQ